MKRKVTIKKKDTNETIQDKIIRWSNIAMLIISIILIILSTVKFFLVVL